MRIGAHVLFASRPYDLPDEWVCGRVCWAKDRLLIVEAPGVDTIGAHQVLAVADSEVEMQAKWRDIAGELAKLIDSFETNRDLFERARGRLWSAIDTIRAGALGLPAKAV